jgi:hypothetical protein
VGHSLQSQASFNVIKSISLSSDGSRIICSSEDGVIQSLDVRTGAAVTHPSLYNDWEWAQFSPDGNQITCLSRSGWWRSIDGHTGQVVEQSSLRHTRAIQEARSSSRHVTQMLSTFLTWILPSPMTLRKAILRRWLSLWMASRWCQYIMLTLARSAFAYGTRSLNHLSGKFGSLVVPQ